LRKFNGARWQLFFSQPFPAEAFINELHYLSCSWADEVDAANEGRVRASLTSVTEFRTGEHETPKATPQNRVDFPASPNYFRLVLKTERSSTKQITLTFFLGSPEKQQLDAVKLLLTSKR